MEVAKVYILEENPKVLSIERDFDSDFYSLLNAIGDRYVFGDDVTKFIHQQYGKYWDRGIPIIHVINKIGCEDGHLSSYEKKLCLFLPYNANSISQNLLLNTIRDLEDTYFFEDKNIYFVKEKQEYGYDYECYPPYTCNVFLPFLDVVNIFLRDVNDCSTEEEKIMFQKFRNFDLKSLLLDDNVKNYPIHHDQCGVVLVGEDTSFKSNVTKLYHENEINYLLSKMLLKDVTADEDFSYLDVVSPLSLAILLIREESICAYFPQSINDYQYHVLSDISCLLDDIYREDGIAIEQNVVKVLPSGKKFDYSILSFREMVDECYQRFLIGKGEREGEDQVKTPTK